MKKIFIFLSIVLLFMPVMVHPDAVFFGPVETMPEFPEGQRALFQFLSEHVVYPPQSVTNEEEGKVIAQFIVEKDGSIDSIKVVRSSGYKALDQEAVRALGLMPKWTPGTQKGIAVRVRYTVPVNFRLPDEIEAPKTK
ncbi:MAG: energy transducer TonB [Paludibacteraceae bacterium]|nr:energy transducer TonB [Paludibacteraceae bacterium]